VAKKFLTSISICYVQEKYPFSFFLKFIFSKLFIAIFTLKCTVFLYASSNGVQTKILLLFTFVKILNHSPAQDLSNKKNRIFLRLLWLRYSSDNLLSFDTNALDFVRPLYTPHIQATGSKVFTPHIQATGSKVFTPHIQATGSKVFTPHIQRKAATLGIHPIYTGMQYAAKFTPTRYRQQVARYSPHTYRH
jgi:hypothetical protein